MSSDDELSIGDTEIEEEADEEGPRPRRKRRFGRWIFLILVVTAAYWAASFGARPAAERWLSQTIGSPVKVRRVGVDPLDAVITFEGFVTRIPGQGLSLGTPIAADRARLDLQWFPLVHKRLQIRELALEGAVIELDEAPNLAPSLETLGNPARPETLPPDWTVQVDRLSIRNSLLKLRSFGGAKKPVEVTITEAEVTATRRRTSQLGAATNLRLDASFEGGNLKATGHWTLDKDEGLKIMADVKADGVPVERVLRRLPELGVDSVSGRLEAEMRYAYEAGHRNQLTGFARLREGKVKTAGRKEPYAEVRNAIADVASLDLDRRRLHVRSLVLRGATFAPESQIGATILSSLADERRQKGQKSNDEKPWRWSVDRFDATGAQLRIAGPRDPDETVDLVATIRGQNLGPRSHWSPVRASFQHGLGSAEFEGSVRTSYDEPRLEGKLSAEEVDLISLATEVGFSGTHLIRGGRVSADLDVLLEPGAAGFGVNGIISILGASFSAPPEGPDASAGAEGVSPSDVAVGTTSPASSGESHDRHPDLTKAHPVVRSLYERDLIGSNDGLREGEEADLDELFTIGATRIDLGVNAPAPPKKKRGPQPPRRWNLDATLTAPFVRVGVDESGWVLPSLDPPKSDEAEEALASEPIPEPSAPEEKESVPPLTIEDILKPVTLGRLAVIRGHVRIEDQAAEPPLTYDVSDITGTATEIRAIPFEAQEIYLQGYGADLGFLELRAHEASAFGGLEIAGEEIPLYLAGPYLERLRVPYRFTGGRGSFVSELRLEPEGWTADTLLILNRPVVDPWTEQAGQAQLGMPLSSAFKLLRDRSGDVRVRVPSLERLESEFDAAVYDAIHSAHEAPGSGGALAPATIGFKPGQSELSPNARSRLRSIARTASSYRNLRVELAAPASLQDRRWFKDRALLQSLDDRGGIMGALRLLGASDDEDRIRRALQARVNGRSWYLEPHEEGVLQELLADQPPVPQRELDELARRRLTSVEKLFLAEGIPYGRLSRRQISGQDRTTLAAVVVTIRTTGSRSRPVDLAPAPPGL